MQIVETDYDWDVVEPLISGAGIIPVFVNDAGLASLMLGKERFVSQWRGSHKWSGFEGGRKSGESVEETAAREFIEESLGVLQLEVGVQPTIDSVVQHIRRQRYVARILLGITNSKKLPPGCNRYHVTYIIQLPECGQGIGDEFTARREGLLKLQRQMRQYFANGEAAVQRLPSASRWHVGAGDVPGAVALQKSNGAEANAQPCKELLELDDMIGSLGGIQRAAMRVTRDLEGKLVAAGFNEDYLEKQEIKMWSLHELERVIANRGSLNGSYFRAYFLPTLQRCVQELRKYC